MTKNAINYTFRDVQDAANELGKARGTGRTAELLHKFGAASAEELNVGQYRTFCLGVEDILSCSGSDNRIEELKREIVSTLIKGQELINELPEIVGYGRASKIMSECMREADQSPARKKAREMTESAIKNTIEDIMGEISKRDKGFNIQEIHLDADDLPKEFKEGLDKILKKAS